MNPFQRENAFGIRQPSETVPKTPIMNTEQIESGSQSGQQGLDRISDAPSPANVKQEVKKGRRPSGFMTLQNLRNEDLSFKRPPVVQPGHQEEEKQQQQQQQQQINALPSPKMLIDMDFEEESVTLPKLHKINRNISIEVNQLDHNTQTFEKSNNFSMNTQNNNFMLNHTLSQTQNVENSINNSQMNDSQLSSANLLRNPEYNQSLSIIDDTQRGDDHSNSQPNFNPSLLLTPQKYYTFNPESVSSPSIKNKNIYQTKEQNQDEIELKFRMGEMTKIQKAEIERWKIKDIKGLKRSYYIKQISKATDAIMAIKEKSNYEKAREYQDSYPCLSFRKTLMKLRVVIQILSCRIITSHIFETITILVILTNSILLALEDPTQNAQPYYSSVMDNVFLSLYTVELVLKIMGMGFIFNKGAYLRDAWNVLDFIIVASAYFTLFFSSSSFSLSGLRAFRVLRPLRTISSIEGLKLLVTALLSALPLLRDTIIILGFFFLIFAIGGVQMLHGYLKRRCVNIETGVAHQDDILCGGSSECPSGYFCGKRFQSPNGDVTNFDNMLYGILTVFQCVTLEGWSQVMVDVQQVFGVISIFFFIPLVFIGAFFLLNLTLAVINSKFTEAHKLQTERNKKKQFQGKFKKFTKGQDYEFSDNHISIRQYQIAKKAAKQMMNFLRIQKQGRLKPRERMSVVIDQNSLQQFPDNNSSQQNNSQMDDSASQLNFSSSPSKQQSLNQSQTQQKFFSSTSVIKPLPQIQHSVTMKQTQSQQISNKFSNTIGIQPETATSSNNISSILHKSLSLNANYITNKNSKLNSIDGNQNDVIMEEESEDSFSDTQYQPKDKQSVSSDGSSMNIDNISPSKKEIQIFRQSKLKDYQQIINSADNFRNLKMSGNLGITTNSIKGFETINSQDLLVKQQVNLFNMSNLESHKKKFYDQFSELDKLLTLEDFKPEIIFEKGKNLRMQKSHEQLNIEDNDFLFPQESDSSDYIHTKRDKIVTILQNQSDEKSVIDSDSDIRSGQQRIFSESKIRTPYIKNYSNCDQGDVVILQKPIEKFEQIEEFKDDDEDEVEQESTIIPMDTLITLKKMLTLADSRLNMKKEFDNVLTFDNSLRRAQTRINQHKKPVEDLNSPLFKDFNIKFEEIHSQSNSQNQPDEKPEEIIEKPQIEDPVVQNYNLEQQVQKKDIFQKRKSILKTDFKLEKKVTFSGMKFQTIDESGNSSQIKSLSFAPMKKMFEKKFNTLQNKIASQLRKKVVEKALNSKDKKLQIVKNSKYESCSENEVLERRIQNQDMRYLTDQYKFIKLPTQLQEKEDPDYKSKRFAKTAFKPFQQKILFEVKSDDDLEEDDEEFFLRLQDINQLELQPFDTLTGIGYEELLQNLPTKQIARTSNIIVTSTLSFTYQPKEKPKKVHRRFDESYLMDQFLQNQSVVKRSNSLNQFQLEQSNFDAIFGYSTKPQPVFKKQETLIDHISTPLSSSMTPQIDLKRRLPRVSLMPPALSRLITKRPPQLNDIKNSPLSRSRTILKDIVEIKSAEPLSATKKRKSMFDNQSNSSNNKQIIKNLRKIKKRYQSQSTGMTQFTLKDAKKIFEGTFYNDDEDDQVKKNQKEEVKNEKMELLKKFSIKNPDLLNADYEKQTLKQFETDAIRQLKQQARFNDQPQHDFESQAYNNEIIPSDLKEELDLPDDLQDRDLDMEMIKLRDVLFKKRQPQWSGQDVLERKTGRKQLIDRERAQWVVNHLNNIRVWPKGIYGFFKKARSKIRRVVQSSYFDNFMLISVLVNTVILALDRFNMDENEEFLLFLINLFFSALFIFEMTLKIISLGPKKYLNDKLNYLDGTVVILSIVEIILNSSGLSSGRKKLSAFKTVRIFRTFRVLRVARLLRNLRSMQVIIGVIQRSVMSFIYIAALLFLFIFIYALLGMQIFGGEFKNSSANSANYDTFNNAFITVFQVLTIENWQTILFDSMNTSLGKILPAIYYLSWIFMGNFILLNLFLAILLDSFIEEEQDKENAEKEEEKKKEEQSLKKLQKHDKKQEIKKIRQKQIEKRQKQLMLREQRRRNIMRMFTETQNLEEFDELIESDEHQDLEDMDEEEVQKILQDEGIGYNQSQKISSDTSTKLAFDTYVLDFPKSSIIMKVSEQVDIIFTLLFTLEAFIKSTSLGFVMDKGSYLRETWNILDFFIVVSSLIDLALSDINLPFIKILRLLRTLRPLRFISHNIAMKTIVVALLESIGHIINVMIVVMVVWLMFAILGVSLFAGKFYYCTIDPYVTINMRECLSKRGQWTVYDQNFDNVGNAMLTLFVVATLEDWPDVLHQAVNSSDENQGPIPNNSPANSYFFVAFILIGSYFLLNFFIGVLFLKYNEAQKAEIQGFSQEHLQWMDMQRMIIASQPDYETTNIPKQNWRKKLHKVVVSTKFETFIMTCIVLNMLQMACQYEGSPVLYDEVLNNFNIIFTGIFIMEAILKIIAFDITYFHSNWNRFDFIVILSSIADILMSDIKNGDLKLLRIGPQLGRVFRVLRVTRILRLVGKYQGIQALIQTITFSLPSLLNVLGLLFLIFFMFAILGVFFFREIREGQVINEYMNFSNFGMAMLMLFRMSTGEDWNYIMFDCSREEIDGCIPGRNCGSKIISYIYFISFILICTDVMLNLFVLVILQQFDKYYLPQNNIMNKFKKNLQEFKDTWKDFSMEKYNCQKIRACSLTQFIQCLKPPLGLLDVDDNEMKKIMLKMGIKSDPDGYIYFNELLYRCMRRVYGQLKLSKKMQIFEIKTQYRVVKLSMMSHQKNSKIKNQDIMELLTSKQHSVNPFLTIMFLKTSFKAWLNQAQRQKQRDRKIRHYKRKSAKNLMQKKEFSDQNLEDLANKIQVPQSLIDEDKNQLVEFEYLEEIEILQSYSSEEEEPSIDLDLQSPINNDFFSINHDSSSKSTQQILDSFKQHPSSTKSDSRLIKDENFYLDRKSAKSVHHIRPSSSDSQRKELIPTTIRGLNNFDTIEEEEENNSMPSIPKKKKSSRKLKLDF